MREKTLDHSIDELIRRAHFELRADVLGLLTRCLNRETVARARSALSMIIQNARIARREHRAICQDTGYPVLFVEAGTDVRLSAKMITTLRRCVSQAYARNCLRPSTTDALTRTRPSHNGMSCHVEFAPRSRGLTVTLLPKGFGSENKSRLVMLNPTAQAADIEAVVLDTVRKAGPDSCPPFIVGVGIGSTSDGALLLAKRALLERLDRPNAQTALGALERRLLARINALGIGPMGFGGRCTALAVRIKQNPTHIAGLPVGVNISCHALRSATVRIPLKCL